MKAILSASILLCAPEVCGEGVEVFVSSSSSPKDIIETLSPDATSFHLVFKNRTNHTYHVLKPVNIWGFSCYHLRIKNNDGKIRSLFPQMTSMETTGSSPVPLAIGPGEFGAIEMFLNPQQHARGWNYRHTWSFTGFQADETELTVSYTYKSDGRDQLDWLSRYKLNGKAELDVCSKPIVIGPRPDKNGKAEQDGAGQAPTRPESK